MSGCGMLMINSPEFEIKVARLRLEYEIEVAAIKAIAKGCWENYGRYRCL